MNEDRDQLSLSWDEAAPLLLGAAAPPVPSGQEGES